MQSACLDCKNPTRRSLKSPIGQMIPAAVLERGERGAVLECSPLPHYLRVQSRPFHFAHSSHFRYDDARSSLASTASMSATKAGMISHVREMQAAYTSAENSNCGNYGGGQQSCRTSGFRSQVQDWERGGVNPGMKPLPLWVPVPKCNLGTRGVTRERGT
jgi:hypothetical protein